jgi:hypothetical protein
MLCLYLDTGINMIPLTEIPTRPNSGYDRIASIVRIEKNKASLENSPYVRVLRDSYANVLGAPLGRL